MVSTFWLRFPSVWLEVATSCLGLPWPRFEFCVIRLSVSSACAGPLQGLFLTRCFDRWWLRELNPATSQYTLLFLLSVRLFRFRSGNVVQQCIRVVFLSATKRDLVSVFAYSLGRGATWRPLAAPVFAGYTSRPICLGCWGVALVKVFAARAESALAVLGRRRD